ncbi:MAG: EamA family transporter [Methylococcaceae bacterium]
MSLFSFCIILICVLGISIGQILFKLAAEAFPKNFTFNEVFGFIVNKYFLLALVIYGVATVLWIYALRLVPLNVAYPMMSLAFVIVPVLSYFFLFEALEYKTLIGTAVIILGLVISVK